VTYTSGTSPSGCGQEGLISPPTGGETRTLETRQSPLWRSDENTELVLAVSLRISRNGILETEIRAAEPQHALVVLAGELDTSNVAQLYEALADLTREGVRHIAINLVELEFVDSTGLSALIAAHKRAEALAGELILLSPNRDIRRLFEVTGIDTYFNIQPSKDESASPT